MYGLETIKVLVGRVVTKPIFAIQGGFHSSKTLKSKCSECRLFAFRAIENSIGIFQFLFLKIRNSEKKVSEKLNIPEEIAILQQIGIFL